MTSSRIDPEPASTFAASWLRMALGMALAAGLLVWAFRGVDIRLALDVLASGSIWLAVAALVPSLLVMVLKAVKWRIVLYPLKTTWLRSTFSATLIGATANCVLPFRTDEIVRGHALAVREGLPLPAVLGTMVVERGLEFAVLLGFSAFALWITPMPEVARVGVRGAAILFVAISVVVALSWACPRVLSRWCGFLPKSIAERADRAILSFTEGAGSLPSPSRLAAALLVACAQWLSAMAAAYLTLRAFNVPVVPTACLTLVVVEHLSFAIPASPGAVGLFELLAKAVLVALFGVPPEVALSFAIVYHLVILVPIVVPGAVLFLKTPRRSAVTGEPSG